VITDSGVVAMVVAADWGPVRPSRSTR
jgi:hypothetical protein